MSRRYGGGPAVWRRLVTGAFGTAIPARGWSVDDEGGMTRGASTIMIRSFREGPPPDRLER